MSHTDMIDGAAHWFLVHAVLTTRSRTARPARVQGTASNAKLFDDFSLKCTNEAQPSEANSDYISVSVPLLGWGRAGA